MKPMMYNLNKYPDGSSYINSVTTKAVTFRINSYESLWHLNQYVDAFNSQYGFQPNIVIPNLIDAQADRRFKIGESRGLKLVCDFLNSMKVKKFYIFHPHNPEVVEALLDNVEILDNSGFIKDSISEIYCDLHNIKRHEGLYYHNKIDNLLLMSADAGGFKPLMKLCEKIKWEGETHSASKSRTYREGVSSLSQIVGRPNFGGKDILIVDDLSVGGGTFKGLSQLLKERNCGKLFLAVSHMTLQNLGKDPVTNYFDKVYTTNSKFDNYYKETKKGGSQPHNLIIINKF